MRPLSEIPLDCRNEEDITGLIPYNFSSVKPLSVHVPTRTTLTGVSGGGDLIRFRIPGNGHTPIPAKVNIKIIILGAIGIALVFGAAVFAIKSKQRRSHND